MLLRRASCLLILVYCSTPRPTRGAEACVADFAISRWEPTLLHPGRSTTLTLRGLGLEPNASAHLRFSVGSGELYSEEVVAAEYVSSTELRLPIPPALPANVSLLEVTVVRSTPPLAVATARVPLAGLPTIASVSPATWAGIGGEQVRIAGVNLHGAAVGAKTLVELAYDDGSHVVELAVGGDAGDALACELAFEAPMMRHPRTSVAVAASTDRETNVTLRLSTNGGADYSEPARVRLRVRPALKIGYVFLDAPTDLGWTANWDSNRRALDLKYERYVSSTALERVAPAEAEAAFARLCASGHELLVATSIAFSAAVYAAAERVECARARMLLVGGARVHPRVSNIDTRRYQPRWLSGVLAGAQLRASGGSTVGYVASFPFADVLTQLNAFALGCQHALPACAVRVVWVSSWNDEPAIRAAAHKLYAVDAVDAIAHNVDLATPLEVFRDGPPVCSALPLDPDLGRTTVCLTDAEAAALRARPARFGIGYHYDLSPQIGESLLATVLSRWAHVVEPAVRSLLRGEWDAGASVWAGGLGLAVALSRRSSDAPDGAYGAFVDAEQALRLAGDADRIFCGGALARADGAPLVPLGDAAAGRADCLSDAQLRAMDYYVRGVADAAPTRGASEKWGSYAVGARPADSVFAPPAANQIECAAGRSVVVDDAGGARCRPDCEGNATRPTRDSACVLPAAPAAPVAPAGSEEALQNALIISCTLIGTLLLALSAYGCARAARHVRELQRSRARLAQEEEARVLSAAQNVTETSYPCCFVPYVRLVALGAFRRHEELLVRGELVLAHSYEQLVALGERRPTVFISHQWLGFSAPDPHGHHFRATVEACAQLLAAHPSIAPSELLVWVDYVSIPQLSPSLQRLAIDTLAVYASTCRFFVAVAPTVAHADTGLVCNADTYASRGFCRLEQWARLIVGGDERMHLFADHGMSGMSAREGWQDKVLEVFQGDFSKPEDRHKLVEPCIGLWILTRQRLKAARAQGRQSRLMPLVELMHARRAEVFPRAFFGNLIEVSEALIHSHAPPGNAPLLARAWTFDDASQRWSACGAAVRRWSVGGASTSLRRGAHAPRGHVSDAPPLGADAAGGAACGNVRSARVSPSGVGHADTAGSLLEARADLQNAMQEMRNAHAVASEPSRRNSAMLRVVRLSSRLGNTRVEPADDSAASASASGSAPWRGLSARVSRPRGHGRAVSTSTDDNGDDAERTPPRGSARRDAKSPSSEPRCCAAAAAAGDDAADDDDARSEPRRQRIACAGASSVVRAGQAEPMPAEAAEEAAHVARRALLLPPLAEAAAGGGGAAASRNSAAR